jgi:hypothetical protein
MHLSVRLSMMILLLFLQKQNLALSFASFRPKDVFDLCHLELGRMQRQRDSQKNAFRLQRDSQKTAFRLTDAKTA